MRLIEILGRMGQKQICYVCATAFSQKIQANVQFFEESGPIFINVNDMEGTKWLTSGLVHDLAEELNGAVVSSDLRFVGHNQLV